jgi:hypothetical protein
MPPQFRFWLMCRTRSRLTSPIPSLEKFVVWLASCSLHEPDLQVTR